MLQKVRYIKYIVLTCFVILCANSCSLRPDLLWSKANDGILLWISSSDTIKSFSWKGEVIDNIPNGSGILSIVDKNGHKTDSKADMFYGAQSIEDVVVMDDGSRYVGAIINDRMEGFGALVKADELYIGYFS